MSEEMQFETNQAEAEEAKTTEPEIIETSLYQRLEALCDDAGQTKTVAVERALAAYLDYYEKTKMRLENNKETILPKGDQA